MTSSPAPDLEPRTEAGRRLLDGGNIWPISGKRVLEAILAIEAEAAAESGRLREALEAARVQFNRAEAASGYLDGDPDAFWMEFAHVGSLLETPPAPSDLGAGERERAHFHPASASTLGIAYLDEWGRQLYADDRDPGRPLAELIALATPSVPPKEGT